MSDTNPKKQEFISPEYPLGPLVVSEANPRYVTVASGATIDRKAVYLTGSHIWNNFHDGLGPGTDCIEEPEQNDYGAYLTFLKDHGHNFFFFQAEDGIRDLTVTGVQTCALPI